MSFAKRVFTLAGIYGLIVMPPLYFAEVGLRMSGQPLLEHPETHYGFVGVTLLFQLIFLLISRDPARYRALMPICVAEKLVFAGPVWLLFLLGRAPGFMTVFASIDLVLAVLFAMSFVRTRPSAA